MTLSAIVFLNGLWTLELQFRLIGGLQMQISSRDSIRILYISDLCGLRIGLLAKTGGGGGRRCMRNVWLVVDRYEPGNSEKSVQVSMFWLSPVLDGNNVHVPTIWVLGIFQ